MARYTATIFDILKSELIKNGFNELHSDEGLLTFFDDEVAFIKKMTYYDTDVQKIANRILYAKYSLPSSTADLRFKKMFVNRFLNREINRQTVEDWQNLFVYTISTLETHIIEIMNNLDKFIYVTNITTTHSETDAISGFRSIFSDLPQTEINLSLNDETMDYATNNNISKNKDNREYDSTVTTDSYNYDILEKSLNFLEKIFSIFDKKLFMQIW